MQLTKARKLRSLSLYGDLLSPKTFVRVMAVVPTMASVALPVVSADEFTNSDSEGWVDVYVDHKNLDDAVRSATAAGVMTNLTDPTVLTGDADETNKNIKTATDAYAKQASDIKATTDKYKADLVAYEQNVASAKRDADNASAAMSTLQANAAANGQQSTSVAKTYSEDAFKADKAAAEARLQSGRQLNEVKDAITSYDRSKAGMAIFETQANQGNITVTHETVKVSSKADVDKYQSLLNDAQTKVRDYVNTLNQTTGSVANKPNFKVYDLVVADDVVKAAAQPVTIVHYLPVSVSKPQTPVVNYHYFDLRSKPKTSRQAKNADNEVIIEATKASSNGQKVVQAMVNQIVGFDGEDQTLPANRFDKMHSLERVIHYDNDMDAEEALSHVDSDLWNYTNDKLAKKITFSATARYLTDINLKQKQNATGTIGGTVDGEWHWDTPNAYFKLTKDNTTYQVYGETIINHEYVVKGNNITIQTNQADPEKHNFNSKMVNIDGKAVLPGSINNYVITDDNDQYKNVNIDKEMQAKGKHIWDVFSSDVLTLAGDITVTDDKGNVAYKSEVKQGATNGTFTRPVKDPKTGEVKWEPVKGKDKSGKDIAGMTWKIVDEKDVPEEVKAQFKGQKVSYIDIAIEGIDNDYYKTYVEGGRQMKFLLPMKTGKVDNTPDKQGGTYNGFKYTNTAVQSDFGNPYTSKTVENTSPLLDPRKDAVLSVSQLASLDLQANPKAEIENGSFFQYRFSTSHLPKNLAEGPKSYYVLDTFNTTADQYDGIYFVESNYPIYFLKGTSFADRYPEGLAANSDVSKYVTQQIARDVSKDLNTATQKVAGADSKIGVVKYVFDSDFLNAINYSKTELQFDIFSQNKRIKDVDGVTNVFSEVINGIDFGSQEVKTNTKENSIDKLQRELNDMTARQDKHEKEALAFQSKTVSALSVIVKNIDENKKASDKGIADNAAAIKANAEASARNAKAISSLTVRVMANEKSIDANKKAISALSTRVQSLEGKTAVAPSTLVIRDPFVLTDADAVAYAVNHGVSTNAITKVAIDKEGYYAVTYNVAKGSLTGSDHSTTDSVNVNSMATKRVRFDYYTLKTADEVRAAIAKEGYKASDIVSMKQEGSKFSVVVNAVAKPEAPKADVKPTTVVAKVDATKPVVKADVVKPTVKPTVTADIKPVVPAVAGETKTTGKALMTRSDLAKILSRFI